jgi:hypothetical protein
MPAEEYHPAFSVVNEVGISIENQHGTLVDEALALLRDTAAIECDTRQSGWRWTPSELEHWKKALACLDNVKTYQNSYGRAVQTSWSMGGWERMPAKDVKWGERISVGKVQEFKPRPKAPTGQERRDEVKAKQVLRSPRRQKDRPELAEQVKKAQERSREKHVGKQMRIAWMALGEMIEGKKEQLRCDSSD